MGLDDIEKIEIQKTLDKIWDDMVTNPSQSLIDSKAMEKQSTALHFTQGIIESLLYQGWCLIFLSRLKEAIEILLQVFENYNINEESLEYIKLLNALGVAYNDLGDNTNAFFYYSRSLKLSRQINNVERELSVLTNMGSYYVQSKKYNKALTHFKQILEKIDNLKDSEELKSVVLLNTGICYSKVKDYISAEKYLLQSLKISQTMHNRLNEVESLFELAGVKLGQNDKESALSHVTDALLICQEIGNKRVECDLLLMLGDLENDISHFEKAYILSNEIQYMPAYRECCLKLSNQYETIGNLRLALSYVKEHYRIEQELNNLAVEKKFHNLEQEYEIERNKKNAELFKIQNIELKESLNWMTILNKIAQETISSLELDQIFNTVYKNINILMDASLFHVVFLDKKKNCLNIVKAFENGNEIAPFTHNADEKKSFAGWAIKNKKEVVINNVE
jgi:tetratricopeptide (TPR) repeat protein